MLNMFSVVRVIISTLGRGRWLFFVLEVRLLGFDVFFLLFLHPRVLWGISIWWEISQCVQKVLNWELMKAGPLSVFVCWGMPMAAKVENIQLINLFGFSPVWAVAHIKCEYVSTVTKTYFCLPNLGIWVTLVCHNGLDLRLWRLAPIFVRLGWL